MVVTSERSAIDTGLSFKASRACRDLGRARGREVRCAAVPIHCYSVGHTWLGWQTEIGALPTSNEQ